jgi:hypothetical protein
MMKLGTHWRSSRALRTRVFDDSDAQELGQQGQRDHRISVESMNSRIPMIAAESSKALGTRVSMIPVPRR